MLGRLAGHFASGGFVHLESCNTGQNLNLLRALASTFGVPGYSATGPYNNVLGFNTGDYVVCQPNGTVTLAERP